MSEINYNVGDTFELEFIPHRSEGREPIGLTDEGIVCLIHKDDLKRGRKPEIGSIYKVTVARILDKCMFVRLNHMVKTSLENHREGFNILKTKFQVS